jgi:hypothetical protein
MDTIVAFNWEYFKVSISTGNKKCCEPEMVMKDKKARVDFG